MSAIYNIESLLLKRGFVIENKVDEQISVYNRPNDGHGGWVAEVDNIAQTINGITVDEFLHIFDNRFK